MDSLSRLNNLKAVRLDPSPYLAPQSLTDETRDTKRPLRYRNFALAVIWVAGVLGLPATTIYESVHTQSAPDFRLGWIHLIAPAVACLTPVFFAAKWPIKIGIIVLTPVVCVVLEVATVIVDAMFFSGLNGIQ